MRQPRAYAQHHDQPIAITVVQNGKVLRTYRHIKFPKLAVPSGDDVPKGTAYWRGINSNMGLTDVKEVLAGHWLETEWGKSLHDLFEQVFYQRLGFALILLWPELSEDDDSDPDENRTSKERLAIRRATWMDR